MRNYIFSLLLAALLLPGLARSENQRVVTDQVQAELLAHAPDGVAAGKEVWLGLLIKHKPHWHTYWKNPGDSGLPTRLNWELPEGVKAGAIQWPAPQRLPIGPLVNYGYEGQVLLAVPLTISGPAAGRELQVRLQAEWLACKEVCIPESGQFSLRLPASAVTSHAALFAAARAAQPVESGASSTARLAGDALVLTVDNLPKEWHGRELLVFPEDAGVFEHAAKPGVQWDGGRLTLSLPISAQRMESPSAMAAVLRAADDAQGPAVRIGFEFSGAWPAADAGAAAPLASPAALPSAGGSASVVSLWLALLLAFAGGSLLNLMPCVFPVLSLKVMGMAQHGESRKQLRLGGLAYTAGVVLSFVALAGLLLALRAGGDQLGWGFQLQSPEFVAALALLFTIIGLNLLGVIEMRAVLPGNVAALRAAHPAVDSALTGVLAVAVASPCTAPFMGAALGVALTMPAAEALSVFASLGLGMAAPYLAASWWPNLSRVLPRPGAWMLHFKVLMAFPMFATVIWLLWVLGQQVGIDAVAALLGLLLAVALTAWVWSAQGLGSRSRVVLRLLSLLILLATLAWAAPSLREQVARPAQTAAEQEWRAWSPEAVSQALAEGHPVFVDFTAAWCVTCQFNKRGALADAAVMAEFKARGVVLMRADWTRRDPLISQELTRLGRSGVPVYLLLKPGAQPQLLPELLSPSAVLAALASS